MTVYLAVLFGIHCLFIFLVYDFFKYRARFKDIYPDHHLTIINYFLISFFPIAFIALTIFLCLKDSDESKHPMKIFKTRYLLLSLAGLLTLQGLSPLVSYMSARPSFYFAVNILHDSLELIKLKDQSTYRPNLFEEFLRKHSGELSSTQLVLLVAVNVAFIVKEKERAVTNENEKKEAPFKYGLDIVEMSYESLFYSENRKMSFMDYSPIQWLHPSGPIEIYLLQMVERQILVKFNSVILKQGMAVLKSVKKKIDKLSPDRKEFYLRRIEESQKKFEQSKTYIGSNEANIK